MKFTHIAATLIAGALLTQAGTANAADTIEVVSGPAGARGVQIMFYGPVGQSFTAINSNLTSFGFQFQTFNAGAASAPVVWQLLDGAGLTGAVIASRTLSLPTTLPARTGVFFDFDITGVNVVAGQHYTAVVSTATSRYGIALGPEYNLSTGAPLGGDAYAGGRAFFTTNAFPNCTNTAASNCDLNFRVTGFNAAAVPEPATWATMLGGMGLIGGAMRRSRRVRVRTAEA
jgi:hypothetical protein